MLKKITGFIQQLGFPRSD